MVDPRLGGTVVVDSPSPIANNGDGESLELLGDGDTATGDGDIPTVAELLGDGDTTPTGDGDTPIVAELLGDGDVATVAELLGALVVDDALVVDVALVVLVVGSSAQTVSAVAVPWTKTLVHNVQFEQLC